MRPPGSLTAQSWEVMSRPGIGPSKQVHSSHTSPSRIDETALKESIAKPRGSWRTPAGSSSAVLTL